MRPVLIDFGVFRIYSYGLFIALGFAAAVFLSVYRAHKENLNPEAVIDIAIYAIIGGVIGARLSYVVYYWDYFSSNPISALYLWEGGLTSFGGFIGGGLAASLFVYLRRLNWLKVADVVAYGLPVGIAIGRIGCFFNGCCYGIETNCPIGVVFPVLGDGVAHLPTQIFESIYSLVIFAVIAAVASRPHKQGDLFFLFTGLYGFFRFLNEFVRVNPDLVFGLSGSQLMSIMFMAAAVIYFIAGGKARRKDHRDNS